MTDIAAEIAANVTESTAVSVNLHRNVRGLVGRALALAVQQLVNCDRAQLMRYDAEAFSPSRPPKASYYDQLEQYLSKMTISPVAYTHDKDVTPMHGGYCVVARFNVAMRDLDPLQLEYKVAAVIMDDTQPPVGMLTQFSDMTAHIRNVRHKLLCGLNRLIVSQKDHS